MDSAGFSYAVGRVRALEAGLLSPIDAERMLGAKDTEDAYRIFNDIDFASQMGGSGSSQDFQNVLNAGLSETKYLLTSITRPSLRWILEILWLRYDFHNLKIGLKARFQEWSEDEAKTLLLDLGSVEAEKMFEFGMGRVRIEDERFRRAREKAEKTYEQTKDIKAMECDLDQDLHSLKLHLAKKSENQFLIGFVQREIDVFNILTHFRLQNLKENSDCYFSDGGLFPRGKFKKEEILDNLRLSEYAQLGRAYELFLEGELDFSAIEREGDNLLVDYMRRTKYMPMGPEPIFSYYWARKNNARILRMIMIGKSAGLSEDKIRGRLRKLYFD